MTEGGRPLFRPIRRPSLDNRVAVSPHPAVEVSLCSVISYVDCRLREAICQR